MIGHIGILLAIIVVAILYHLEPMRDTLSDGTKIIWYNALGRKGNERKYIKYGNRKKG